MIEHPDPELFHFETPVGAYYAAVRRARVGEDGRLCSWRANGYVGGSMKVENVDPEWGERVLAWVRQGEQVRWDQARPPEWE